jgi:hypothetical protein
MNWAWKLTKLVVITCLSIVAASAVYFTTYEYYMYFSRNEKSAQVEAKGMFSKICERNALNEQSFHGPERDPRAAVSDGKQHTYTFLWTRNPGEEIEVTVTYLPYETPYSISAGLVQEDWRRRNVR